MSLLQDPSIPRSSSASSTLQEILANRARFAQPHFSTSSRLRYPDDGGGSPASFSTSSSLPLTVDSPRHQRSLTQESGSVYSPSLASSPHPYPHTRMPTFRSPSSTEDGRSSQRSSVAASSEDNCSTLEGHEYTPVIVQAKRRDFGGAISPPPTMMVSPLTQLGVGLGVELGVSSSDVAEGAKAQKAPVWLGEDEEEDGVGQLSASPLTPQPNERPPWSVVPLSAKKPNVQDSPRSSPPPSPALASDDHGSSENSPPVPGLGRMRSFLGPKVTKHGSAPWGSDEEDAEPGPVQSATLRPVAVGSSISPGPSPTSSGGFSERKLAGKKSLSRLLVPSPILSAGPAPSRSSTSSTVPSVQPKTEPPPLSARPAATALEPGSVANSRSWTPRRDGSSVSSPGDESFISAVSGGKSDDGKSRSPTPTPTPMSMPVPHSAPTCGPAHPAQAGTTPSRRRPSAPTPPSTYPLLSETPQPRHPNGTAFVPQPSDYFGPQPVRPERNPRRVAGGGGMTPSSSASTTNSAHVWATESGSEEPQTPATSWQGSPVTERAPLPSGGAWVTTAASPHQHRPQPVPHQSAYGRSQPVRRQTDGGTMSTSTSSSTDVSLTSRMSPPLSVASRFSPLKTEKSLKSKKSGFLRTLKKAVGGGGVEDVRSLVSGPVGGVIRNGGADPLPLARPLIAHDPKLSQHRSAPPTTPVSAVPSFAIDPPRGAVANVVDPSQLGSAGAGMLGARPDLASRPKSGLSSPSLNLRPVSMAFSANFSADLMALREANGDGEHDLGDLANDRDQASVVSASTTESSLWQGTHSSKGSDPQSITTTEPVTPRIPFTPATTVASLPGDLSNPGSAPPSQLSFGRSSPGATPSSQQQQQDEMTKAKKVWKIQLWELEKQAKMLRAEIDGLRAERADLLGFGEAKSTSPASSQPCDKCGCTGGCHSSKNSVIDRPRGTKGTGGLLFSRD